MCVKGMILLAARPHSHQLLSFYGLLPLTWPHTFYLLELASRKICQGSLLKVHTHTHFPSSHPPLLYSCTYISSCHLGSDTRGIGLWQVIHTADRWLLLCLTEEKIEWEKERGREKKKRRGWGRRWRGRYRRGRYKWCVPLLCSICVFVCVCVCSNVEKASGDTMMNAVESLLKWKSWCRLYEPVSEAWWWKQKSSPSHLLMFGSTL